ncbi:hypothetical protein DMH02_018530 [Streptomyces sp. WAC 00631]|uniref:hypothetical protein n=1 Tax=Streptomyces sp. WAC 00631 TaxID=2203201 RepID=UPI001E62A662|nr:hypothetical protein [Streptomyces sp. WAC 00631]MCC5035152.1 hypothetical protein [Streptomyces sp. WAC 00631]
MADNRYSWLDEDAAERLLRGEPLDVPGAGAGDGPARERARRLSAALQCVADPARLPAGTDDEGAFLSEAVVLAAFRETAPGAQAHGAGPGTRGRSLFRLPRTTAGGGRRTSLGRPLRAGIAAALAGCALGGVAVAAGTGVLPTPFNHSVEPGPTGSAPGTGSDPSTPGHGAGGTDGESPGDGHEPNEHGEKSPGTGGHGGTKGLGGEQQDRPGDGEDGTLDGIPGHPGFGDERTRGAAIVLCRKYTADTLDGKTRERLEAAAGGPAAAGDYCARLLNTTDDNDAGGSREGSGSDTRSGKGTDPGGSGAVPGSGSPADPYTGAGPGTGNPSSPGSGHDGGERAGDRGDTADRPRTLRDRSRAGREDRPARDDRSGRDDRSRGGHRDSRSSGQGNKQANSPAGGTASSQSNGQGSTRGITQSNSQESGQGNGRANSRSANGRSGGSATERDAAPAGSASHASPSGRPEGAPTAAASPDAG